MKTEEIKKDYKFFNAEKCCICGKEFKEDNEIKFYFFGRSFCKDCANKNGFIKEN